MEELRRKRLNFLQNVSIALLTLSAVVLFAHTQFYNLGKDFSASLLNPAPSVSADIVMQSSKLSAPLRVTVSDIYGRYGSIAMTTANEEFAPLDSLLKSTLGSAKPYSVCSGADYLNALSSTSVYYDFLTPLPLSVIASFCGITTEDPLPVRTLIISDAGNTDVTLYLWDGSTGYYRADTAAAHNDLTETVGRYELGSADLAMDLAGENSNYAEIHPCSMFLRELPLLPELTAEVPAQMTDRLLLVLDFNPNTKYRSTEASGAELIVENDRSLRVQPNGAVHYLSTDSNLLTIESETGIPTLQEAASHGGAFLLNLLSPFIGDASIYLQEIYQTGNTSVLRFGYQLNGVPLRFADGSYAAEMTLIGTVITSLDLNIRQYTASGSNTALLPLPQALAIAARQENVELSVGYVDQGITSVSAAWLAD